MCYTLHVPVLTAKGLSHAYGDRPVLDNVSLTIGAGERVGLIGQNGTGKSTLARALVGEVATDGGEVALRKEASLSFLAQEVAFTESQTPRAYILAGLGKWTEAVARYEHAGGQLSAAAEPDDKLLKAQSEAADDIERHGGWDVMHRVEEVATHLGVDDLDKPLAAMSGGERRRVALAQVLVARPTLAILDEPTNQLDIGAIEWLENYLCSDYPGAVVLITHDRYMLDRVAQRTLELDGGQLYGYSGGWDAYLSGKAERLAHAARREANRQNALRRELEWLRRSPKARTTKSQARVDRAIALRDDVAAPTGQETKSFEFAATRSGKTVIELSDLQLSVGGRLLIDGLDLSLCAGDRVGIIGKNGSGKTSLLRTLLGQLEPDSGSVVLGRNAQFAYFDQERADLDDDKTIVENVADNREVVEVAGRSVPAVSYLVKMSFTTEQQRQKVGTLSGGERARVAMAKFLLSKANVLLLDEPTNDLDVSTLAALEELLVEASATVLFVTHDRYFLDRVATSVLSFEGGGRVVRYADSAQAIDAMRTAASAPVARKRDRAPAPKQAKPKGGLTFTERHELEQLMPEIEEAEAALAAAEAELADPDLYATRGAEVPALQEKRDAASRLVEERISRWEFLESKRSG